MLEIWNNKVTIIFKEERINMAIVLVLEQQNKLLKNLHFKIRTCLQVITVPIRPSHSFQQRLNMSIIILYLFFISLLWIISFSDSYNIVLPPKKTTTK